MKRLTGSRFADALVVIAILVIPLMYGGLLTSAYHDPTNRLDTMTAAVVNEDTPADVTLATGTSEHFALGDELTDRLTHPEDGEDVGFTWVTMTKDQAEKALKDEDVRAMLEIPAGFTEAVTKVGTTDEAAAARQYLQLRTDDGVNYLAGTLARSVAISLEQELTAQGAERYVDNIVVSLGTIRDGMTEAADGAETAQSGSAALTDGLTTLADGTRTASTGADTLASGARTADGGAAQLADGARTAANGAATLASGISDAHSGAATLAAGATSVNDGAVRVRDGATSLAAALQRLSAGATTFVDGVSRLDAGASSLAQGVSAYTDGVTSAAAGAATLADGARGLTTLADGIDTYTTTVDTLRAGVVTGTGTTPSLVTALTALSGGLGTPDATGDPTAPASNTTLVAGADALSQSLDTLHTQLTDPAGAKSLHDLTDGAARLASGLDDQAKALSQAQAACASGNTVLCQKILDGLVASSADLTSGAHAVADGAGTVAAKVSTLADSSAALADASHSVTDGARRAASGAQALRNAVGAATDLADPTHPERATLAGTLNALTASGPTLRDGAERATALVDGSAQLSAGLDILTSKNTALVDGATQVAGGAAQLNGATGELSGGIGQIDEGAGTLVVGLRQLADGTAQLSTGATTLADGAGRLDTGAASLTEGNQQLATGASALADGTHQLSGGATTLADGLKELASGADDAQSGSAALTDGLTTLADGLQSGVDKIPAYSEADASHIADVISTPVQVDGVRDNGVANNGAGFTPMFMSLSLWIGGIAMFLVLPALDRRSGPLEKWWKAALRPAATATLLALGQAVLLMVGTNAIGGLRAANLPGLVALAVASSLTFVAVNQACVAVFAYRGRFVSILLLCLQITSMGATFPIETTPGFFQWIHPFLPMSYTQLAFREMIAGSGATDAVGRCLAVLAVWFVVAVVAVLAAARVRQGAKPLPRDNALLGDSIKEAARADAEVARVRRGLAAGDARTQEV